MKLVQPSGGKTYLTLNENWASDKSNHHHMAMQSHDTEKEEFCESDNLAFTGGLFSGQNPRSSHQLTLQEKRQKIRGRFLCTMTADGEPGPMR